MEKAEKRHSGFSLVVTVSILVLLALIAVGLLSLGTTTLRSINNAEAMDRARANAQLALTLAIAELQESTGPDQRVTASADLLLGTQPGRAHWTGVWNTEEFDPTEPESKEFVRWLVSSPLDSISDASAAAENDDVLLFEGVDDRSSVRVPRVSIHDETDETGSYAYWVEDEGLKADLSWNEGEFETLNRIQIARLSSAPGPDYAVFGGPLGSEVEHPISREESSLAQEFDKALSPADIPLVTASEENQADWLRSIRHDITMHSRGLLSDVKNGGLRRDLGLAFEMDGTSDTSQTSQPTLFNQQEGEFVGGSDHLSAQHDAPGMPVRERFLYRVTRGDGSPFSDELQRSDSVVRGPNWWALRDYYNLYKRIEGSSGVHTLQARSYYPNNSAGAGTNYRQISQPTSPFTAGLWDDEQNAKSQYIFHPARANYAPILMGVVGVYSAKVTNGTLGLSIDPLIYLWNPYNVRLEVSRYGIGLQRGHGGKITFKVRKRDEDGNVTETLEYGPAKTDLYIKQKVQSEGGSSSGHLTYLVSDLSMAPGEVMIVSPGLGSDSSATDFHDEAAPGTNLTNASGITIEEMPLTSNGGVEWQKVSVGPQDEVLCLYDIDRTHSTTTSLTGSAEHFWMQSFLPNDPNINAGDLISPDHDAERIQIIGGNLAGRNWGGVAEYLLPETSVSAYPESEWPTFTAGDLAGGSKFFFGINSHLLKPANFTGVDGQPLPNQNPTEVFSQFNPFRTASFVEGHRVCQFNEAYISLSKPGDINSYLQEVGIQFPPNEPTRGFWGQAYHGGGGSTVVPFIDIPTAPLLSLADFANANLSLRASEPYKKVGNSHASIFVPANSLYAQPGESAREVTASDGSWLINDALFDRYYLSGLAPQFSISSQGYQVESSSSTEETLNQFFGKTPLSAQANPALQPYLPKTKNTPEVVASLAAEDGYKKLGAYSFIKGAFNVNSTSTLAWESLLQSNRNLAIRDSMGGTDSGEGTPFPNGATPPPNDGNNPPHWSGFSRLSDDEISELAEAIVAEVKERGPFMSLSEFVNRQLSGNTQLNAAGALQAALDETRSLSSIKMNAGGIPPVDPALNAFGGPVFPGDSDLSNRLTTEGIAGDIRQADLLRPLAPRLSARSDTFRIRAYGEALDKNGNVLAEAICEAVVQRMPEYLDPLTDPDNNEPWDERTDELDSDSANLNTTNEAFGRRYALISFRWLSSEEI